MCHQKSRMPVFQGLSYSGMSAMLVALAMCLGGYLLPFEALADESVSHTPTQALPAGNSLASRLAVSLRQGRCRALNLHLGLLAKASDSNEAESALKSLSLLTGEMMNTYSVQGGDDPDSSALPEIYTAEGRRELQKARESLRYTLHEVRGMEGRQAAVQVSAQCQACHALFMRDGGAGVTLSFQGNP